MRFAWAIFLGGLIGAGAVQAQFLLLPDAAPPRQVSPKPVSKIPKIQREAATHGNFPRRMKREEIEALFFTEAPIEATGLGRASFRVTFYKNGTAERLDHQSGETEQGKWRFLGDGYCSKWGKAHEGCYTVVKDGNVYKVVLGTRAVAFWSAPAAGESGEKKQEPALQPIEQLPAENPDLENQQGQKR